MKVGYTYFSVIFFQVEPGSFFQRLTGGVKTGIILKDVSFATNCGEVTAILGSKGNKLK